MRVRLSAWLSSAAVGVATVAAQAVGPLPIDRGNLPLFLTPAARASPATQFAAPSALPGPPATLSQSVAGATVTLIWGPPTSGGAATGFSVEAALTANGPALVSIPHPSTTLTVPDVPAGVYFVRVRAVNAEGAGPPSNEVTVVVGSVCAQPPAAPTGLVTTPPAQNVTLTWSPGTGGCAPTGFLVRAGPLSGQPNVAIPVGMNTTLTGTAPAGTYFVSVVAVNAFGASPPSNEVLVVLACAAPGPPVAFTSNVAGHIVSLQWEAPATGGAATAYLLEAGFSAGATAFTFLAPATTFVGNAPDGTYFVRVRASNACGVGPPSIERTVIVPGCGPPLAAPAPPSASTVGGVTTISWGAVSGAVRYRLDVGTAMGASNISSQETVGTSQPLSGLASGTYFMRVTPIDACSSAGPPSGESSFSVSNAPIVQLVTVSGPSTLVMGQSATFTAIATFVGGATADVSATASWRSSNESAAIMNGRVANALNEGSTVITAIAQGQSGALNLQVTRPQVAPNADVFVDTDDDTLNDVNDGQCAATRAEGRQNRLRCTFNGTRSTPPIGIASYRWAFSNGGPTDLSGEAIDGNLLNFICGSFGDPQDGLAAELDVTLTVSVGGQSSTVTKKVTIIKVGAC